MSSTTPTRTSTPSMPTICLVIFLVALTPNNDGSATMHMLCQFSHTEDAPLVCRRWLRPPEAPLHYVMGSKLHCLLDHGHFQGNLHRSYGHACQCPTALTLPQLNAQRICCLNSNPPQTTPPLQSLVWWHSPQQTLPLPPQVLSNLQPPIWLVFKSLVAGLTPGCNWPAVVVALGQKQYWFWLPHSHYFQTGWWLVATGCSACCHLYVVSKNCTLARKKCTKKATE